MRMKTWFARTSSHASLLVDPEVLEDVSPVHATELTFPVVALDPRLGSTKQRSDGPHGRPLLLGHTHEGLLRPLLLLLDRGGGQHLLVVLVKQVVVDIRGAPAVL